VRLRRQFEQTVTLELQESFLTFEDMESVSNAHTAKQSYEYTIYGLKEKSVRHSIK
jgi:hypothetical protein